MSDVDPVLDEALHTIGALAESVTALQQQVSAMNSTLERYAFMTLVSKSEGLVSPEAFEQLGGVRAVRKAVRMLYDRVMADPTLAPYFKGADLNAIRARQVEMFLALLGARDYEGDSLGSVHKRLHVSSLAFETLMHHLDQVLEQVGVPRDLSERLIGRFREFQTEIVSEA